MNNRFSKLCIVAMICAVSFNSCIGSFSLFNKFAQWNANATDSKYLNAVIGWLLCWVYPICGTVDFLVLNTIEFWSGENPLADAGKVQNVMGSDGHMYAITTTKKGYEVKNDKGELVNFVYDKSNKTWTVESNGMSQVLLQLSDDQNAQVYLQNGKSMNVKLNNEGVTAFRQVVEGNAFYAFR